MAKNNRKKTKLSKKPEVTLTLKGADKELVKACFARAYEMEQEGLPVANGCKGRGRKPHWTRKNLISEMTGNYGDWIIEKYREPLRQELARIISAGQSGIYLDQAKMVKKYGERYSSVFDVSGAGSYVTYFLGITDAMSSKLKWNKSDVSGCSNSGTHE